MLNALTNVRFGSLADILTARAMSALPPITEGPLHAIGWVIGGVAASWLVSAAANLRQHGDDARHLIAEARLLSHAGEWDGISSGAASGRTCRRFHNLFDAEQRRDDGAWPVLCNAIREPACALRHWVLR